MCIRDRVSGVVTTTATRSVSRVWSAKFTLKSSSLNVACVKGCLRSTYCRLVLACAHSACPLDNKKLNVPNRAICGTSSRKVNDNSATLGTVSYTHLITDHIAVLRPHSWLMLGHCAGLRTTQQLGDYVLAHAYVREDHVLDEELPLWVPIPALAEIQVALERACLLYTSRCV